MKFTKTEKGWIMYDWANSVYATVMLAAIFPIYFTSSVSNNMGDTWWGIGTSIATATVAITAPILGAIIDYKGMKKKVFGVFLFLGLAFTLFSALVDIWQLMLIGYVVSHIGFSGGNLVYDSFLTDVTDKDRVDKVSSYGFSMGYIGGSTIPFLICIALITFGESFGVDSTMAVKISLVITVLWWGLFSIPFLKNVEQKYGVERKDKNVVKDVFLAVWNTAKKIMKNKAMFLFIIAYFFYIDGVNTVITMSTSYGTTLGLDSVGMILALLVTQIVAFPCAIIFGNLSRKFTSINMIKFAIAVYIVICTLGFYMGFGIEEGFLSIASAQVLFWIMAAMVGTVQGGIQAISRAHFAKLVPPENSGEYFGFFDIFGKFAAVMGPAIYAAVSGLVGRSSYAILSVAALFIIGMLVLLLGSKHIKNSEIEK